MSINKWDLRFLRLAALTGSWSKSRTTKVGSVIVDRQNRVISIGYNGYPIHLEDTIQIDSREEKLLKVIHAEENALLFKNCCVVGFKIYVTHPPCPSCLSKIIQSGITEIITIEPSERYLTQQGSSRELALSMIKEVNSKGTNLTYTEYTREQVADETIILSLVFE